MKDAITLSSLSLVERLRRHAADLYHISQADIRASLRLAADALERAEGRIAELEVGMAVGKNMLGSAERELVDVYARAEAAEAKLAALSAPLPGAETSDGEALVNALDNPPPPTEKLRNLMAEKPPWGAAPPTMDGFGIGWREVPGGRIKATMTDEQDKTDA